MPKAEIATHQAKHTLEQLHAELAGKIDANKAEALKLTEAMLHVEAVLKMLDPAYDVRPIAVRRRTKNPWFKRGTMFRAVLATMKDAGEPLSAREIAVRMLEAKGVEATTEAAQRLESGVRSVLKLKAGRVVEKIGTEPGRWVVL